MNIIEKKLPSTMKVMNAGNVHISFIHVKATGIFMEAINSIKLHCQAVIREGRRAVKSVWMMMMEALEFFFMILIKILQGVQSVFVSAVQCIEVVRSATPFTPSPRRPRDIDTDELPSFAETTRRRLLFTGATIGSTSSIQGCMRSGEMEPEQDRAVLVIIALLVILVAHHFVMHDKVLEARQQLKCGMLAAAHEQDARDESHQEDVNKLRSLKRQMIDFKEHVKNLTIQIRRSGGEIPLFPNSFRVKALRNVRKHKSTRHGDVLEENPGISEADPHYYVLKVGYEITVRVINEQWLEEVRENPTLSSIYLPRCAWQADDSNCATGPDGAGRKNFTQVSGTVKSPPPSIYFPQQPQLLLMNDDQLHQARILEMRNGQWLCDECNSSNYAFRTHCYKCRGVKPAGSVGMGDFPFLPEAPSSSRSFVNQAMNPGYDHQAAENAMNADSEGLMFRSS